MDRGDGGFIFHESFKDLRTRRAEQEAYRRALEEQISLKKKLQEQELERKNFSEATTNSKRQSSTPSQPPLTSFRDTSFSLEVPVTKPVEDNPYSNRSARTPRTTQASIPVINEIQNTPTIQMPYSEIPQQYMEYLQQVMPSFAMSQSQQVPLMTLPESYSRSPRWDQNDEQRPSSSTGSNSDPSPDFSNTSSSEASNSSSSDDVIQPKAVPKMHVSQTSEELAGVKVSRSQYRVELQQQIDERKRREEEQRRREKEEEERIQQKIRQQQEQMQREYEEELKKLKEKEKTNEAKRLQAIAMQNEINRAEAEMKKAKESRRNQHRVEHPNGVESSPSDESMKSICEFYDSTMMPTERDQQEKIVNPDDRIVPVVAKRLQKELEEKRRSSEFPTSSSDTNFPVAPPPLPADESNGFLDYPPVDPNKEPLSIHLPPSPKPRDIVPADNCSLPQEAAPLNIRACRTATFEDSSTLHYPPPHAESTATREMSCRSAPGSTSLSTGATPRPLEFLQSLQSYLSTEKNKMDQRLRAKMSRSNEHF